MDQNMCGTAWTCTIEMYFYNNSNSNNYGCDGASWNPLLSDTDFTLNIHTDSNANANLPLQLLANSVTKKSSE